MKTTVAKSGPVPQDALDYFRGKGNKTSFDHRDVWREEHAHSFTVAKATQTDVLAAIRGEVDRALAEGRTLAQFQKELKPRLEDLGWWGKKEMTDPVTGEVKKVQLGSPHRLRTIYNANLRTAYAAGQWAGFERNKAVRPYLLYTLGPSRVHRPEHVAWHGIMLPVDDPFWDTHSAANGYECKCQVRGVSRAEAERLRTKGVPAFDRKQLINPETGLPTGHVEKRYQPIKETAPEIKYRDWLNKRTGVIERVPAGIDPGWDTNPGKVRQQSLEKLLSGKLAAAPPEVAAAAMRDLAASGRYRNWFDEVIGSGKPRGQSMIIGVIDATATAFLRDKGATVAATAIEIDDRAILHSLRDAKEERGAALPEDDMRRLPELLLTAERYWDSQNPALLYVFDAAMKKGKAVVRIDYRRKGKVSNQVVTTGLVKPENLGDPRYLRVPGEK